MILKELFSFWRHMLQLIPADDAGVRNVVRNCAELECCSTVTLTFYMKQCCTRPFKPDLSVIGCPGMEIVHPG